MANAPKNDVFANIAAQRIQYRDKTLVEPEPPVLPVKSLPAGNNNNAVFSPKQRIDSAEKLLTELVKFREKFSPFTGNMAPELTQTRVKKELIEFMREANFDWVTNAETEFKQNKTCNSFYIGSVVAKICKIVDFI